MSLLPLVPGPAVLGTCVSREFQKMMFNCRLLTPGLPTRPGAEQKLTWLSDSPEGTRLRRSGGSPEQTPPWEIRSRSGNLCRVVAIWGPETIQ